MTYSGRYGLVHPNAEAVYAAHALWFRFGSEPDFQATLDDLYEETVPLLDIVAPLLHPVSSVEDLSAKWEEIVLLAEADQNAEVLTEQTRLIWNAVNGWGLRCAWAASSLLYTLGNAHKQRVFRRSEVQHGRQPGIHVSTMNMPEYVPRWEGEAANATVHSGLLNPNTGGYVGTLYVDTDGHPAGADLAKGSPYTSFHDAGLGGFTVRDEAAPAEVESPVANWQQRSEKIREEFQNQGMVEPRRRGGGPDVEQIIDWLFARLSPPGLSWGRLAARINKELEERRQHLEELAAESNDDFSDIDDLLNGVHGDYQPDAVAFHVNRLRKLLLIERAPGIKEKYG